MNSFILKLDLAFQKIRKILVDNQKSVFIIAAIFVAGALLIPFLRVTLEYGHVPDIYPIYGDIDHNYYYARIREVIDGKPFLGNPYYLEHSDKLALAFSSAEWILALPILMGTSFVFGLLLNNIIWISIFFILLFYVIREVGVEKKHALVADFFIVLALAPLIVRPVAMQIVFPFFLFFLLCFLKWLRMPNFKNSFLLVCASVSNFYIYSFSWQIIAVALLIAFGYFTFKKDSGRALNAFGVGAFTLVGSFPVLYFTVYQAKNPLYWESALRTSMAITRLPSSAVIVYGGPLLIALALFFLVKKFAQKDETVFALIMTLSMFVAAMSNVITAKDPEVASHVGRYMALFTFLLFAISITKLRQSAFFGVKRILVVILIGVLFLYSVNELRLSGINFMSGISESVEDQAYAQPLNWLEDNIEKSSVILANLSISGYVPVLTRHYVVFSNYGANHVMTNQEQIDRYLLSSFNIAEITEESLKNDLRTFAGTGPAIHQHKSINRRVRICKAFRLDVLGYSCGNYTDALTLLGADYLPSIVNRAKTINSNLGASYDRFGVAYLIIDTNKDQKFAAISLFPDKIYDDGRFQIWAR